MSGANAFLIVIIVILVIIAIIFLVLWLVKGTTTNNQKRQLAITGVKIICNGDIVATWTGVGNAADRVTLYAASSPIDFHADGTPSSTGATASQTVPGAAGTVSIPGAMNNTKYYVSLVVTNPNFVGFNVVNDIISTCGGSLQGNFIIQEMNTPGAIQVDVNDQTKVVYSKGVNKSGINDIWTYDSTNFTISTRSTGVNSTAPRPTLYDNNGILSAKPATPSPDMNSQWVYNSGSPNSWCIRNTTRCMSLPSPIQDNSGIAVQDNSDTRFVNIPTNI